MTWEVKGDTDIVQKIEGHVQSGKGTKGAEGFELMKVFEPETMKRLSMKINANRQEKETEGYRMIQLDLCYGWK